MTGLARQFIGRLVELGKVLVILFMRRIVMTGDAGSRITLLDATRNQVTFVIRRSGCVTATGNRMAIGGMTLGTGEVKPLRIHMHIQVTLGLLK